MARPLPPLDPPIGPFVRGLNQVGEPRFLPPNVATAAVNVDLQTGALQAAYGPGDPASIPLIQPDGTSPPVGYKWLGLGFRTKWIAAINPQHLCLDTKDACYCTDIATDGTVRVPRSIDTTGSLVSNTLGLVAPAALALSADGGAGGTRAYAVTFATAAGLESNPFPTLAAAIVAGTAVRATLNVNAVLTIPTSTDSRVTRRNVYATDVDDLEGNLYLIGSVANNTGTSFTDTGLPLIDTAPLNWSPGGQIDDDVTTYDHSPWRAALVLADQMHGATPGAAAIGTSILMGTDDTGYKIRWSATGAPQYQPTENEQEVPEQTQAIRSHGYQTLAFLTSSIWSLSGEADFAIVRGKTDAERGVRLGCGATVRRCPWGVLFLADGGVALYSDNAAPLITQGLLDPLYLEGLSSLHATFADDVYRLYHSTGTIVLDMRDYPNDLRVSFSTEVVDGAWVNHYDFSDEPDGLGPGLYIRRHGETPPGLVRLWSASRTIAGATRQALTWQTPELTWGEPTRQKRWAKLRYDGEGAATFAVYRDGEAAPRITKTIADLTARSWFWLGRGFAGKAVSVKVTSPDGTAVLRRLELEGVLLA